MSHDVPVEKLAYVTRLRQVFPDFTARLKVCPSKQSMRSLVSLRQKSALTVFGGGEQVFELGICSNLYQQRIGLQRGVGTIISLNGFSQQAQSSFWPLTVSQQGASGIQRFDIHSRKGGGFDLLSGVLALGAAVGIQTILH
jgi:hypothetical protein